MKIGGRNDLVIAHRPGDLEAEKGKAKYIEKATQGDIEDWEILVLTGSQQQLSV